MWGISGISVALPGLGLVVDLAVVGAVVVLLGGAAAGSIRMANKAPVAPKELAKQVGMWLGILALLPLAVWYGGSILSPPPDQKKYSRESARVQEKLRTATDEAEREKLRQESDRLDEQLEAESRVYYRDLFWVAYPAGLVAVIVGTFFPVQTVGAGLMFGGLISLASGCYSYWDRMEDWVRFASLLLALVVLVVLGTWRFRAALPPEPAWARTSVRMKGCWKLDGPLD